MILNQQVAVDRQPAESAQPAPGQPIRKTQRLPRSSPCLRQSDLHCISSASIMPRIRTKFFGELDYPGLRSFDFPQGLPGFETSRLSSFWNSRRSEPLMFLQSLVESAVSCFILLPVLVVDPQYRL